MKTALETVQDFLFKDKPKRSYCHKRDVKDWAELLQKYAIEYHNDLIKKLNTPNTFSNLPYTKEEWDEAIRIKNEHLKFMKELNI